MALPDARPNQIGDAASAETNPIITLIRFGRPHTLIATTFQVAGIFLITAGPNFAKVAPTVWLSALVASLCANLFVVGLNQLTDVGIDRLNKPALPLAAGTLAPFAARRIVASAAVLSIAVALTQGLYLTATMVLVMLIGSIYSLRPFRLKGRPVLAALSIALARGLIANLGLYFHYRNALTSSNLTANWIPAWPFLFFFGFGLIIALFKDIPDREGDGRYAVRTFAVRWGCWRVFNLGRLLLVGLYCLPLAAGLALLPTSAGAFLLVTHFVGLLTFLLLSLRTDPTRPASMMRLYLTLWGLFYAEFILLAVFSLGNEVLA